MKSVISCPENMIDLSANNTETSNKMVNLKRNFIENNAVKKFAVENMT